MKAPWRAWPSSILLPGAPLRRQAEMASRTKQKEEARARRLAEERARAERARRDRRIRIIGGVVIAAGAAAAVVIAIATSSNSSQHLSRSGGPRAVLSAANLGPIAALGHLVSPGNPGPLGPEQVPGPSGPALAPAGSPSPGQTVDGISCQGGEQTVFHIHTHLTIFVNGSARQIPAGVGIASPQTQQTTGGQYVGSGACFSWLHTHAADGIIHIESPVRRGYTLGNFFDIWGQSLSANQVGPVHGAVTAFYNGKHYIGNPQNIPLGSYTQIQLDVGKPLVAPEHISFSGTGL